ncbi:MAG: class I SAM-dependent methyltransferase [Candidatus Rokuibacteriota bacterium]
MKGLGYWTLTGAKRVRGGLVDHLRGTPLWGPLRAAFHAVSPLWRNALVRRATVAVRGPIYRADPRGYWQREGGRRYLQDEAHILGPGSLTERHGEFLAAAIADLGAKSVLEVGVGYGRLLREIGARLPVRLAGADFSEPQLHAAREYLAPAAPPLVLADATRGLPFGDRSFDLVYTQGSLMHVPPPGDRAYRAELARVARRFVVHTEDVPETESTFAHDNAGQYRELGLSVRRDEPYALNMPGQRMRFQVFERAGGG